MCVERLQCLYIVVSYLEPKSQLSICKAAFIKIFKIVVYSGYQNTPKHSTPFSSPFSHTYLLPFIPSTPLPYPSILFGTPPPSLFSWTLMRPTILYWCIPGCMRAFVCYQQRRTHCSSKEAYQGKDHWQILYRCALCMGVHRLVYLVTLLIIKPLVSSLQRANINLAEM